MRGYEGYLGKYIKTKNGKIHQSYNEYQAFDKLYVCKKPHTLADFYCVRRSSIIAWADSKEELGEKKNGSRNN